MQLNPGTVPNLGDSVAPDQKTASLYRRLAFAGESGLFFDRLFSLKPFTRFALLGGWHIPRLPDQMTRIGFDLFECIRTASRVPSLGNVELAMLDSLHRIPQHPEFLAYWHDAARHALVGMHVNFDLFRHRGKYYVFEMNFGPHVGKSRRTLYDTDYDPIVSGVLSTARSLGFATVVGFAWQWRAFHTKEFERAGPEHGLTVKLINRVGMMRGLPRPLPRDTMFFIHNGLATPLIRYIDDKWYTAGWLKNAIENELPPDSLVAAPPTYDRLTLPPEDPGPRWPNLVIKLARSNASRHVIAARFDDEQEARETLGLTGATDIPRKLRMGYATSRLFGRDRVVYQAFVPPDLDEHGHARSIRLHMLLSPLGARLLSGHVNISQRPVPDRVPRGLIRQDDAFISNRSTFMPIPPEMEPELRQVAEHLGQAMQRAIARKFLIGPPEPGTEEEKTTKRTPEVGPRSYNVDNNQADKELSEEASEWAS